jgi:large subunit ribosomal protein L17
MPHQAHLRTLGRVSDHRLSMLRNLAVAVLRYERVKTTEAKAKEVRRFVDRIVNLGRDGSLNARRRALALTRDRLIVEKTFTDLRERFGDRGSGYTRLVRLGHRVGDGAPMMLVELLEGAPAQAKPEGETEAAAEPGGVRGIARRLRGRGQAPRAETTTAEAPPETKPEKAEKPRAKAAPKKDAKKDSKPAKAEKKAAPKRAAAKKEAAGDKKKPAAKKKKGD